MWLDSLLFAVLLAALPINPNKPTTAILSSQVRAAEIAFARSMADRDHAAFTACLADEAVFFSREGATRGKEAVAADWKPFFEEKDAPFSWAPEEVAVLDSGTLGISSGPVLAPDGRRIGTFNSIWRLESDGKWRIIFDKGCPRCQCPEVKP